MTTVQTWMHRIESLRGTGVLAAGEYPAEPGWLLDLIGYVARWQQPTVLCLFGLGEQPWTVSVRLRRGIVRSVFQESTHGPRYVHRLAALDACAFFGSHGLPGVSGRQRFRYAVCLDARSMMENQKADLDLNWSAEEFCMELARFCDVLADEEPLPDGLTNRRYRFTRDGMEGIIQAPDEEPFLVFLRPRLAVDGPGLDAALAARLAGVSEHTAGLLLMRLWRSSVLTDRIL